MVKKLVKFAGNMVTAVIILIIVMSVYSMIQYRKNPDNIPTIFGYSTMSVLTGSMRPYLQPGDIIVDKAVRAEEIKVGDVVTYKAGGSIVTHRVVKVIDESGEPLFRTRGDANNTDDGSPISEEQLIGRVIFRIPYGGYVARFIRSPIGLLLVIVIPVFFMLYGELKPILSGGKSKKGEETKSEDSINI
jgi:signal peptidase